MKVEFKSNNVVITIPCSKKDVDNAPESKKGKSRMIASSKGFMQVPGAPEGVKLSLNLIAPKQ